MEADCGCSVIVRAKQAFGTVWRMLYLLSYRDTDAPDGTRTRNPLLDNPKSNGSNKSGGEQIIGSIFIAKG
jgi:hypothetical protein